MAVVEWDNEDEVSRIKENNDLYLVTGQISNIKTLFEVIKDIILDDINIVFEQDFITIIKGSYKEESNGDKIMNAMVHLKLDTEFFEFFHLKGDKITVGVNSVNFFTLIKTAKNSGDTISFYIKKMTESNKKTTRKLVIRIENSAKEKVDENELTILNFKEEIIVMPEDVLYPGSIITPSQHFQRIFKDIKAIKKGCNKNNKRVEIVHTGHQLIFHYNGFCKKTVTLGHSKILKDGKELYARISKEFTLDDIEPFYTQEDESDEIINGTYDLDYLLIFAKAASLNNNMLIRIQNDQPLILEYKVGVLGRLHLLLTSLP